MRMERILSPEEERELRASPEWMVVCGLIAFCVAGVLAMVATWFLVAEYPIPDDDAVYLGLLGFLFVMIFDVLIIVLLLFGFAGLDRRGERTAAVKLFVKIFLLGLLAALVVGFLLWLLRRLVDVSPWVPNLLVSLPALWVVASGLARWRKRRARKAS